MEFLKHLILAGGFLPHGYCYLWTPGLVRLHVISDSLIGLSYLSIPATLVYFAHKRRDIPFRWIFVLFGAFIVACGMTHLFEVWTIWFPSYWLAGVLKAATAGVSAATAILLIRATPLVLALPGNQWLLEVNRRLSIEVEHRAEGESNMRRLSEDLEKRVTERTAALVATNRSLQESELRYRTLVEHAPEAIVVLNLDTGRFADANGNAERLFGMSREDLLRAGPADVSPPFQPDGRPSKEAAIAELRKSLNSGMPRFEWMHRDVQGKDIPCEVSLVRLPSSTQRLARGSVVDISERKRAEAEIQKLNAELERRVAERTAELEAANRDLESFTYSVSHDLRAPLRHADGFARILVEEYGAQLPPGAMRHLNRVREATLHMGRLVDDLLNLARVGRSSLKVTVTDLNQLVAETIASLEPETRGRAVEWRVSRLSPVECDPGLIRQVFFNLVSNALKFTRPREKALIEIAELSVDGQPVILVRDNGVGFNMKYADKLFQVFQRMHGEGEFEGTGVGLAIVHRVLLRHGGAIYAESTLQNGATFYFSVRRPLPAMPALVNVPGGAA